MNWEAVAAIAQLVSSVASFCPCYISAYKCIEHGRGQLATQDAAATAMRACQTVYGERRGWNESGEWVWKISVRFRRNRARSFRQPTNS